MCKCVYVCVYVCVLLCNYSVDMSGFLLCCFPTSGARYSATWWTSVVTRSSYYGAVTAGLYAFA